MEAIKGANKGIFVAQRAKLAGIFADKIKTK
jgi:hypothetical protein